MLVSLICLFDSYLFDALIQFPRADIWGPLLFIIFLNSIFDVVLSSGSRIILYADDMVLYKPIKTTRTCLISRMILTPFAHGPLPTPYINATKTNSILITRKKQRPELRHREVYHPLSSSVSRSLVLAGHLLYLAACTKRFARDRVT